VAIKDLRDNLKRLKDADPVELASQVNNWLQESGEALKVRIEDEVEKAVTKRGFVKRSEFQKLEARLAALEGKPKSKSGGKKPATKSSIKKTAAKKSKKRA
jgi:ribosomal protein L31E